MDSFLNPKNTAWFCWLHQQNHVFFRSNQPHKFISKLVFVLAISFCLNPNHLAQAGEFSVAPMIIHIDGETGQRQKFEFIVHARSAGTVAIEVYTLKQVHSGHMEFFPLKKGDTGLVKWITLDTNKVKLEDNERKLVRGELKIPRRMRGSHLAAIMVTEIAPKNVRRLAVTVRYAVVINLKLAAERGRLKGSLSALKIEQREEGNYVIADFSNTSARTGEVETTVDIRDENRLLIERISLFTKAALQKGDTRSRVFPKTTVGLRGLISRPLRSGTLNLSARSRFDRNLLPRQKTEFRFEKEQSTVGLNYKLEPITIQPTSANFSKNKFVVSNPYKKMIRLSFPAGPRTGSGKFLFRPRLVTLEPGESHGIMLTQHWGNDLISTKTFRINLAIGHKWHEIKLQTILKDE